LIFLGLILVLIAVSTAVFFPVYPPSGSHSLRRKLLAHGVAFFLGMTVAARQRKCRRETMVKEIAYKPNKQQSAAPIETPRAGGAGDCGI
jgi:hypothetical protein